MSEFGLHYCVTPDGRKAHFRYCLRFTLEGGFDSSQTSLGLKISLDREVGMLYIHGLFGPFQLAALLRFKDFPETPAPAPLPVVNPPSPPNEGSGDGA